MGVADGHVVGANKIVDNGNPAKRFNLVLLADGYTAAQLPQFATDAQAFATTLFATPPYDRLHASINVYRIDVSSTDSGADDPTACGGTGAVAATYFDAAFCNNGTRRLLEVNNTTVINVANAQVPQWNMLMVIVNSPVYGGSGGQVAVFSLAAGANEIALHEMGHTAFGFADEYEYYLGCGIDTNRNMHPAVEPAQPNVTIETHRDRIKWRSLILPATAMPTTQNANCALCDPQANPVAATTVGAFEGADYYHCGAFRPQFNCRMRALGQPFCAVCQQRIEQTLAPYDPFRLHTGTPLVAAEDGNGDFFFADFDRDGIPDLYFIKRRNTGTNSIEVHVLSGASNYQQFTVHTGTPLVQAEDGNGSFGLADFDRDGIPDLYFIKRRNTGTNSIEVHVLSGASNYQNFTVHTGTPLVQGEDGNGDFLLGDWDRDGIPDLYFIKRRNTGTNTIEVHVLSGASNYQNFTVHTGTPLVQAEDGNGDFDLADFDRDGVADLYFIKRRNTGTNRIEVHALSGASSYQQFVLHTGTALAQGEDGNGDFRIADFNRDAVPDLYFVKRRNAGTNSIEVHVVDGHF